MYMFKNLRPSDLVLLPWELQCRTIQVLMISDDIKSCSSLRGRCLVAVVPVSPAILHNTIMLSLCLFALQGKWLSICYICSELRTEARWTLAYDRLYQKAWP
jgi:hypothetical protein